VIVDLLYEYVPPLVRKLLRCGVCLLLAALLGFGALAFLVGLRGATMIAVIGMQFSCIRSGPLPQSR
jgi:hypothetical protein